MPIDPITNPGAWKDILVGGRRFPGKILDIRNLQSREEINIVRAVSAQGHTMTHRGRIPIGASGNADNIEIDIGLDAAVMDQRSEAWREWYQFVVFVRGAAPPKPAKPPKLAVRGASFKGAGVLSIMYSGHNEPMFRTSKHMATILFKEGAKSTPWPAEEPEPAILDASNPTPRTAAETMLSAAAATSFGTGDGAPSTSTLSERYPGIGSWGTPQ